MAEIITYNQTHPEEPLIIQGYTDNQGDTLSNVKLSKARASTIQQALLQAGIVAECLAAFN